MKKVISIVLALLMMIPMAAMLVPTASAATTTDVSANGSAGKVYYEENFDDVDPTLVDADLAAAIGWAAPSATATMWMDNGALHLAAQYTPSGVYPATEAKWGSGYATTWVDDVNLLKNATVVEYTVTSYRKEPIPANDKTVTLKDGTTKTIKADGQGNYQGFGAYFIDWAGTDNYLIRFNSNREGYKASVKAYDTPSNAANRGTIYWKSGAIARVGTIPLGEEFTLEYVDNPTAPGDASGRLGSYFNTEYRIKHVVEPHANRCFTFINDVLVEVTNPNGSGAGSTGTQYATNGWRSQITKVLGFHMKPGIDVKIDDIKVEEFVPALTISEVMGNGLGSGSAVGSYQWVEITNPGYAPVNVYDYAIETCMGSAGGQKIGDEVDQYKEGSGSTVGYFTPGAKTLGDYVFDSPAYADGVLQPGESAIVLLPYTAVKGGLDVSDEAFNAYLKDLGMPEGTKTFVADNKSDYPQYLLHYAGESFSISILKVNNKSTNGGYDPEAAALGQTIQYINAFAECTAIVTAKGGGGTNWFGMAIRETYHNGSTWVLSESDYNKDGFLGHLPLVAKDGNDAYIATGNKSFEINYTGWYTDAPHSNIQWGFAKYSPLEARKGINGTDVYTTPGFVPTDCRRAVYVDLIDVDGNATSEVVKVHSDVTVATPTVPGYDTRVLVNGEVVVAKATGETATVTVADSSTTIKVELYREGSGFVGYQTTAVDEDGYYNLRLLAAVNSFEDYEKLGFRIALNDGINETEAKEYEVQYVYTAVTAYEDGSEEIVEAGDYKSNYLYAIHINGISADDYAGLSISVEAIYMIDGEWQTGADGSNGFFEIVLD